TDAARSGDAPRRRGAARADSPALKLRCGSCGSWGSGWGRGGGGGRLALLLLVLGAEAVGDDLLQAAFLVAGLVAGLGQLAVLPFVVVEEAVVLRLIGALAALDAALVSRGALRLRRLGLAAFAGLLGHEGSAPRKGAAFYPARGALTMAWPLQTLGGLQPRQAVGYLAALQGERWRGRASSWSAWERSAARSSRACWLRASIWSIPSEAWWRAAERAA